jgi:membrane-associated phospholipid phosphatase
MPFRQARGRTCPGAGVVGCRDHTHNGSVSTAGSPSAPSHPGVGTQLWRSDMIRLGTATGVVVVSAVAARTPGVSRPELAMFRTVNNLPPSFEFPLTIVMQLGALGAVPASAGVALIAGKRALALDLLTAGSSAWLAAKAGKVIVARERPGLLIAEVLLRGRPQSGRGFPSGHAAVAAAMATVAGRHLGAAGRLAASVAAQTVALARVYVGAHLPVDSVGGAAMGIAIGSAVGIARMRAGD